MSAMMKAISKAKGVNSGKSVGGKLSKTAKRGKGKAKSATAKPFGIAKDAAAGRSARNAIRAKRKSQVDKADAKSTRSAGRLAGGTAAKKKTSTSATRGSASAQSAAKGMGKTTTRRPAGISKKATKTVKSGNQGVRKSVSNSGVSAKKKTGVRTPSVRTPKVETPSAFRYYSNKK